MPAGLAMGVIGIHRYSPPSLTNDPRPEIVASGRSHYGLAVLPTRATNARNRVAPFRQLTQSQLTKGLLRQPKPHREIRRGRTTRRFLRLTRWASSWSCWPGVQEHVVIVE